MNIKYKSNNNVSYSCKYHVVWCSKYRRKVLTDEVELRLKEIITSVCQDKGIELLEMEVMPEHIHLLLDVDPQFGIHRAVKAMKGKSSRELRKEFSQLRTKLPTLWSNSYFVSTSGGAPLELIKTYIQNQKTYEKGVKYAADRTDEVNSNRRTDVND